MKTLTDNPLYENFVSPYLCRHLHEEGLTDQVTFHWLVRPDSSVELLTRAFDVDSYYANAWNLVHKASENRVVPAYTIKDVEKALPDYYFERMNGQYSVAIDAQYKIDMAVSARLPDALALMLQRCIIARVFNIFSLNELLINH